MVRFSDELIQCHQSGASTGVESFVRLTDVMACRSDGSSRDNNNTWREVLRAQVTTLLS